jgi:farnesyl-diphosphate farnesyltransferase
VASRATELAQVPDEDLAWCHAVVQDVSRTFAISIDVLDEPTSSYVCVGYLVCRIADTIEDARTLDPAETVALLDRYDRALAPTGAVDADEFETAVEPYLPAELSADRAATAADWALVADAGRVLRTLDRLPADVRAAIVPPTRVLLAGMATVVSRHADRDGDGIRIQSVAELEEYCYYVAGTVGHLVTNLVARDVDDDAVVARLRATAPEFGQLLQLVNVAKDVHTDYVHENSVYLPADWLDEVGVAREAVLAPDERAAVASVVARTADHARSSLDDAHAYLDALSTVDRDAYAAWAVPFLLAVGTLRELSERPGDALAPDGVKVSRDEVGAVVAAVTGADPALADLRESVRRGELS